MNEYLLHLVSPYLDIDTKLILGIPPNKLSISPLDICPKTVYLENKKKLFKFHFGAMEIFCPVVQFGNEFFVPEDFHYTYEAYVNNGHVMYFPHESFHIPVGGSIKIIGEEYE